MAGDLDSIRDNWEALAQDDPLWAVLTDPQLRGQGWRGDEFLASGEREIETMLRRIEQHASIDFAGAALDFGCGAGRLTQALGGRFSEAHGVDIAPSMLAKARELTTGNVHYHLNGRGDLRLFEDDRFGFVYSSVVLQHMQPVYALDYVREFLRVTVPGGLVVFQIPDRHIPLTGAARLRDRIAELSGRARRKLALGSRIRQRSLRVQRAAGPAGEMEMHALNENTLRAAVQGRCDVLDVALTNSADVDFNGDLRYLDEPPAQGWVSKQYALLVG